MVAGEIASVTKDPSPMPDTSHRSSVSGKRFVPSRTRSSRAQSYEVCCALLRSPIIREAVANSKVAVKGAVYDIDKK